MNPYALPAIITLPSLLVLGLAAIFQNPQDKLNRFLLSICLIYGFVYGAAVMLHLSSSEAEAQFWNKWPWAFIIPIYILRIEYVLQISGRSQRINENFLWLPISIHRWIIYSLVFLYLIILLLTDLVIAPPKFYSPTGWEHQHGPLFTPMILLGFYGLLCFLFILYRGIKLASNLIERKARIITMVAMIGSQIFSMTVGAILPKLGLQTHSLAPFGPLFMCFLLTYGLLKMQWDTIKDLKNGLEEKIAVRTEELSIANKRLQNAQKQISKYIDPNVAEKIFEGEFSAELCHRRTKLTMFFSDIQDFTQFTDASDPEDVAKLLNEYLGEMGQIVRTWGGTIPQFTGDSIYAIFGAPDSQGERDDALACVRMAVEMQERMKTLREKWWNQGIQFPFEIRCGLHTGMANVGNYGSDGFMEYSAIGLNTNLASRLEQVCKPGDIYLSHATWALIKDEVPCEEVGTIEVKGFHYPIQTYRVLLSDEKIASVDKMQ
jgi:class 3 adenylate cyclase